MCVCGGGGAGQGGMGGKESGSMSIKVGGLELL